MENIECGTLYDLAQIEMSEKEPMEEYEKRTDFSNIGAWFSSQMNNKYYMILNKELSDYTVLNFITMNYDKAIQELTELFECRGPVLMVEYNHEYRYFEIWVRHKSDDMPHMYIIFPCPEFVIEV